MKKIEVTLIYLESVPSQKEFSEDLKMQCRFVDKLSLITKPVSSNNLLKQLKKKHRFKDLPCLVYKPSRAIERVYGFENIVNVIRGFGDEQQNRTRRERETRKRAETRISRKQQFEKRRSPQGSREVADFERSTGVNCESSGKSSDGSQEEAKLDFSKKILFKKSNGILYGMCGHVLVDQWIQPGMIVEFQHAQYERCPKCLADNDELVLAAQEKFDAIAVSWEPDNEE